MRDVKLCRVPSYQVQAGTLRRLSSGSSTCSWWSAVNPSDSHAFTQAKRRALVVQILKLARAVRVR